MEGNRIQWNKHLYFLSEDTLQYSMKVSIEYYNGNIRLLASVCMLQKVMYHLPISLQVFTDSIQSSDGL